MVRFRSPISGLLISLSLKRQSNLLHQWVGVKAKLGLSYQYWSDWDQTEVKFQLKEYVLGVFQAGHSSNQH